MKKLFLPLFLAIAILPSCNIVDNKTPLVQGTFNFDQSQKTVLPNDTVVSTSSPKPIPQSSSTTSTTSTMTKKKIRSIDIFGSKPEMSLGDYTTLEANIIYEDGSNDKNVFWKTSDSNIIQINDTGKIRALQSGKATITISAKNDPLVTKSIEINVKKIPFYLKVYSTDGILISSNDPSDNRLIRAYNFVKGERPKFLVKIITASVDLKVSKNINVLVTENNEVVVRALNQDTSNENEKVFFVEGIGYGEARIRIELKDYKDNYIQFPIGFREKLSDTTIVTNPCQSISYVKEYYPRYRLVYQDSYEYTYSYSGDPSSPAIYNPQDTTGSISDFSEKSTFNGKVFDTSGVPVDDATVTAKSIDPCVAWTGEPQKTQSGAYVFRNAPPNAKIEITAKKDGWTSRTRIEMLKLNLTGDPKANVFDFGSGNGPTGTDPLNLYAIQDEPEVISLKINGKIVTDSDGASTMNPNPRKPDGLIPNVTGISSDSLTAEIIFSEPVRRDDVENYFRVTSQANFNNRKTNFTIDRNLSSVSFAWGADDTSVTVKTSKAILANKTGDEAKYMVDFTAAFRDKTDKASKFNRYFRFTPTKINDFAVFSVKNQDADPFITNVQAIDGGSANDTVRIMFSKPMDVINQTVPQALLADPKDSTTANDSTLQLYAYNTNNLEGNNVTILGYKEKSTGNFKAVYSISKLSESDLQLAITNKSSSGLFTKGLGGSFTNILTQYGGSLSPLKSAKVENNMITLELNPQAFDKDDKVIVSAGDIEGGYNDTVNGIFIPNLKAILPANASEFVAITDPSGRKIAIDEGTCGICQNDPIRFHQKIATAN
ncbi:MAG: Ig-like domain-containing protein [Cyanobacteriota bacterium]